LTLHQQAVEPAAVLESNILQNADMVEAQGFVQAD